MTDQASLDTMATSMAALAPEVIVQLGPLPITNTIINTILVDAVILAGVFALKNNIKKIPGTFQNIMEMVVDGFYNLTESIAGENTPKIFPYFFTFFIFILIANWSGLLPGAESVGLIPTHHETAAHAEETPPHDTAKTSAETTVTDDHAPADDHTTTSEENAETLMTTETTPPKSEEHEETAAEETHIVSFNRNLTSDLNATLALAIISLSATHMLSVKTLGFREYIGRFLSLNPILLFVGILELVSEFTKIISLSFRLFGNIFAGEVVLGTISKLFAFIFPLPFISLELIVGIVQALVFSMLTMVFMSVLMTSHHEESHTAKEVSH